jgi:hypothetical protein
MFRQNPIAKPTAPPPTNRFGVIAGRAAIVILILLALANGQATLEFFLWMYIIASLVFGAIVQGVLYVFSAGYLTPERIGLLYDSFHNGTLSAMEL